MGTSLIKVSEGYWEDIVQAHFERLPLGNSAAGIAASPGQWGFELDPELYERLYRLSGGDDFMIYIMLLTVYKIVLERICGTSEFAVGVPPYFKDSDEHHANPYLLSLNNRGDNRLTVKQALSAQRASLNELYRHQFYPGDRLYGIYGVPNRVNAYIGMRNLHQDHVLHGLLQLEYNELMLIAEQQNDKITVEFHSRSHMPAEECSLWSGSFRNVLAALLSDLEQPVANLELVDEQQKQQLLQEFNGSGVQYPVDRAVHELFEEQVNERPNQLAVWSEAAAVTYKELNRRANRLAWLLRRQGIAAEAPVAVLSSSSADMVAGILAVLKAGGTYIPIDPEYPSERIAYILQDSGAGIALVDEQGADLVKVLPVAALSLDAYVMPGIPEENLHLDVPSERLAYIIYTSGTTGNPKGVAVEHRSLVHLCFWHNAYYQVDSTDLAAKYAGVGFDASVWEIFPVLLAGAALHIVPAELRLDARKLNEHYERCGITIGFLPTSIFERFIQYENRSLKRLLTGAEKLKAVREQTYELYNNYGPTEYTVVTTSFRIDREYPNIPIGRPVGNTRIYILNQSNRLQPVGVAGELCISGDGLARGYLHNEELTSAKFTANPYEPGERMYRTGDLARWRPDGNIEYLGRIDQQVKIRGFRVELGEIESRMLGIGGIREAAVKDWDRDGTVMLCGYYVADAEIAAASLREALQRTLPDYMVPACYMRLRELKVTANGKIDRRALPEPEGDVRTGTSYTAPRSETERIMAGIWAEVLGMRGEPGIHDDFFGLGGHSLKVTALITRIHEQLDAVVSVKDVFTAPTIAQLSELLRPSEPGTYGEIRKVEEQEFYEASSAQKRMFVLHQLNPDSMTYHVPGAFLIRGGLDESRLNRSLLQLIRRHEALRTRFAEDEGRVVQKIVPVEEVSFAAERFTAASDKEAHAWMADYLQPFDLSSGLPIRAAIIALEQDQNILLLDIHHIAVDGTSAGILIRELSALYSGRELAPLKVQYKDYSEWQLKRHIAAAHEQEDYWLSELQGELPLLNMPADFPRPREKDFRGGLVTLTLDAVQTANMKQVCRETGSTLFMFLLSAINIVLYKSSGQEDIIVGTPVAGRNHRDTESLIGVFVNTLPIRTSVNGSLTFEQLLGAVKRKSLHALENQEYPFENLVEKLQTDRDLGRNPLFDVMFVLQESETGQWEADDLNIQPFGWPLHTEKFDLTWEAAETDGGLEIRLSYAASLFTASSAEALLHRLTMVINAVTSNAGVPVGQIEIMGEEEKKRILYEFNPSPEVRPQKKTLMDLFQTQAKLTPERPALVFNERIMSYGELERRANALARTLRSKSVLPDDLVAVRMNRSPELIIALFAIWKAGAAYLPVDPAFPEERTRYILQNSGTRLILTDNPVPWDTVEVLQVCDRETESENSEPLEMMAGPDNLAYVIYTSGTTGNPKGVAVQHKGIMNTLLHLQSKYPLNANGKYLLKTNYTFDVSVCELFGWFFEGGQLVILPQGAEREPDVILAAIAQHKITHINFTSSMFNMLLSGMDEASAEALGSLQYILTAGEALTFEHHGITKFILQNCAIENLYGPTEASIYATGYSLKPGDIGGRIPIGRPLANTRMYIIDSSGLPTPVGVEGELCIAGAGLAQGYYRNEELTAQKFTADPYFDGERMYRTGDVARWLPDGNIEYLGRIDHQVKIRGYRIELGDVENTLMKLDGIQKVLVVDKELAGGRVLVAYYVSSAAYTVGELRSELNKRIPEYMIPAYFIALEQFPLNSSGKIDRRALPELTGDMDSGEEYAAAESREEELLVRIWSSVLGIKKIGVLDDFFNLGGDSIKAMQVVSKIREHGYYAEVKDIFRSLTIRELNRSMRQVIPESIGKTGQGPETGEAALTPIQRWFFSSQFIGPHHWNQAVMLHRPEGFEASVLDRVLRQLVRHHDSLRLSFKHTASGRIIQQYREADGNLFELREFDLRGLLPEAINKFVKEAADNIQSSMDLERGPLFKLGLFRSDDGDHLLMAVHHLAVDGVSWRIIFEDLAQAYRQVEKGADIKLPLKTLSYRQWSSMLTEYAGSSLIGKEIPYWQNVENCNVIELPKDDASGTVFTRKSARKVTGWLSETETDVLLKQANAAYRTEINDLLLTALVKSVARFSGNESVLIHLEGHGREEIAEGLDITRTVGWFTSMFPVVFRFDSNAGWPEWISYVKDHLRQIPGKGIGYGMLKYLRRWKPGEEMDFRLRPEIGFNYLGQFDADLDTGVFGLSPFDTGAAMGPEGELQHALEFTGLIRGKRLCMELTYSAGQYIESSAVHLLADYMEQLKQAISHCTGVKSTVRTISDLTREQVTAEEVRSLPNADEVQYIYPLAPAQKGILFHSLMNGLSDDYYELFRIELNGRLDLERLEHALQQVISRYEMLRANIDVQSFSDPMLLVYKHKKIEIVYLNAKDYADRLACVQEQIDRDRKRGFRLDKDMLIRLNIVQTADEQHTLIFSYHHIIMDGWSMGIVLKDLFQLYNCSPEGPVNEVHHPSTLSDYTEWMKCRDDSAAGAYWKEYLAGFREPSMLPSWQSANRGTHAVHTLFISNDKLEKLEQMAALSKVTLNTIIQAVWSLQLQHYNGQSESVFGYVVSGRNPQIRGIEQAVGLFINTLPLRVASMGVRSFEELIRQIHDNTLESRNYDSHSLADIQALSEPRENLFNHIMVFENFPIAAEQINADLKDSGLSVQSFEAVEQTHYPLAVIVSRNEGLLFRFMFNSPDSSDQDAEMIVQHFTDALEKLASGGQDACDLALFSDQEDQMTSGFQVKFNF
ncbi:non-ribosomal peptide synthetase [Paenibacillus odorifer]|uniref:non-ribosomal peptide synthetase n=1 Tax=Paenibacillus odorifer TaxID=189426 RepID=UPI0020BFB04B|nr:non-ribosomal peptide synthetase [Paenibacillus odorifer]